MLPVQGFLPSDVKKYCYYLSTEVMKFREIPILYSNRDTLSVINMYSII